MYKTLYSYESNNDTVLSFPAGKIFNLIEQLDEHWWSMQDEFGNHGLIPASYLEVNKINEEDVLYSIKKSADSLKKVAESRGRSLNDTERRNLGKLKDAYEAIKKGNSLWTLPQQPKRQAPKAPAVNTTSPIGSTKREKSTKRHSAPPPPQGKIPSIETKERTSSSASTPDSPGVPSKIYNIQISHGDASPLETKTLTSPSHNSGNGASSTVKVTSFQGKNLRITKTESIDESSGCCSSSVSGDSMTSATDSFISGSSGSTLVNNSASNVNNIESGVIHHDLSEGFGKELVDNVRSRCKISFNKALAAVRCVLQGLGTEIPAIQEITKNIEKQIQDEKLNVYKGVLANEDAQRLYNVLERLSEHKEDSQQRNWAVHEDYQEIKDLLEDVVKIIDEIDPSISKSILKEDEHRYMNDLVLLYQMEQRPKLRISLLHVFGCCCQLGEEFVSTLLCSVLPTELAQDIAQDQGDISKFLTTTLMLTMLFSTGEPVPYHHYVQFNDDFVDFVLNTIEDPPDNDIDDQVSDTLIGMLLSFNQHFKAPKSSTLIQVLRKRTVFRTLTEKILLLLNRETDPVALFDFVHPCPDSVLKFLIDVFSAKETSEMFFTNDLYVLFDIILRQLVNREEKDKVRTEYLSLFHSILNTTDYASHKRHASEFKRRLSEILQNEENESDVDLYIVREIFNRFGHVFG